MGKKRIISIIFILIITLGVVKLYQTYAIGNYIDSTDDTNYNIYINSDSSLTVAPNSISNVFYMVNNTSPGTVNYGIGYNTDADITVRLVNTSEDPSSGLIEEYEKKYVKLRIENNSTSSKKIKFTTILGYSGDNNLIIPEGITLVTKTYPPKVNLATHITNLYTNANKTEVENNSITYNYATSVSLMNDRLGSSTTDADAGNIRYYGANPDNYIYFNCDDYNNQTSDTCELWRIIGVFNNKVKIMRNTSIGELAWDQDKNIDSSLTTYDNDWSTSSLQVLLNKKYYNGNTSGTVTYYSHSDGSTSISLDLTNIGIKSDITRNMISQETYYLRGYNSSKVYSDAMYNYERETGSIYNSSSSTSWDGKIALAYPSDYGYAVDLRKCNSQTLYDYDNSDCASNNWMTSIFETSNLGWLLTNYSSYTNAVWRVNSTGNVRPNSLVYSSNGVNPVLYLDPELVINDGIGTEVSPYQIS